MRLMRTYRSADSLVRAFQPTLPDSQSGGVSRAATNPPRNSGGIGCGRSATLADPCASVARRWFPQRENRHQSTSAFTLVEIAISMAIIGFAVVAIIGVLPLGLNVQRDNREETIINNEANFFMDAIRSGARGLDDLTNHVFAIKNSWTKYDTANNPWTVISSGVDNFTPTSSVVTSVTATGTWLDTGSNIVGLLSTPKFTGNQSNYVVAYTYAMSGSAGEQLPQSPANIQNFAFAHRMIVEIYPVPSAADPNSVYGKKLTGNLHEIRLFFRWPLYANGNTGTGRQHYRTLAGGLLQQESPLHWYFHPEQYTQAQ